MLGERRQKDTKIVVLSDWAVLGHNWLEGIPVKFGDTTRHMILRIVVLIDD